MQAGTDRANSLTSGHRACQGCGEALGARYALDAAMRATGGRLVAVNATGCLEVFSTPYPETSWQIAVVALAVRQRPAVATGRRGGAAGQGPRATRGSIAQAGDGGTVDIGFGCLSGMFERNDDVLLHLLRQRGLHEHRRTAVGRDAAGGAHGHHRRRSAPSRETPFGQGKNLPLIAMAHGIPYVATATVADLHDLEDKVNRAMEIHGARYIHILVTCPLGWGSRPRTTPSKSRGWRPRRASSRSSRRSTARSSRSSTIRRRAPVDEYLRLQGRFAHLFDVERTRPGPTSSPPAGHGRPQHRALWAPRG